MRDKMKKLTCNVVDWCEENYIWHPYIAEFWNSFSSLPIALVSPLVLYNKVLPEQVWEDVPNVNLLFWLIVIVGLGSFYFHATLSVFGQVMDELGIIWLVLHSGFIILPGGRCVKPRMAAFIPPVFAAFVVATTLIALISPHISHIMVLTMAPIGLYIYFTAYWTSQNETVKEQFRFALRLHMFAWACWLTDRLGCRSMQDVGHVTGFRPELHAVWHVVNAFMIYYVIRVCFAFHREFSSKAVDRMRPAEIV